MGIKGSKANLSQKTTRAHSNGITRSSCQMQGWREYMEDYILIQEQEEFQLYGVFDGHGGKDVSEFLSDHFYEIFEMELKKNPENYHLVLESTFETLDTILAHRIASSKVGSTANIVLVTKEKVYIANLGDSRAILFSNESVQQLSQDHNIQSEYDRIISNGGYIRDDRINGSLTVARAFGDFFLKSSRCSIISSKPDIVVIDRPQNKFILLASDGIWECADNQYISKNLIENNSLGRLFNQLIAKNMNQEYGYDNMSAILIQF
ncbi:unnamed protein product (macronuclear) [Paramecium tetraurelia]|uniref:protein-serine/threonine phosphatase n=1 Tax=Paramecium tetraurelia TaxID=5888 RepID=A0DMA8_PARTE|nr:uncharacterized protein GSPATT00018393001 [Paramecium tetraurelia]CAK84175.1 unnamed protein product [Paramecium tetraurelia]|eukprot:XP_001451572.1 hypothetical protein (macronuclear) [Paramecium tetraurelia strain d4-2]